MTEAAKLEVLKMIAFGDMGTAREIMESLETEKKRYFYDDAGNEYWYDRDGKRHYTRQEG